MARIKQVSQKPLNEKDMLSALNREIVPAIRSLIGFANDSSVGEDGEDGDDGSAGGDGLPGIAHVFNLTAYDVKGRQPVEHWRFNNSLSAIGDIGGVDLTLGGTFRRQRSIDGGANESRYFSGATTCSAVTEAFTYTNAFSFCALITSPSAASEMNFIDVTPSLTNETKLQFGTSSDGRLRYRHRESVADGGDMQSSTSNAIMRFLEDQLITVTRNVDGVSFKIFINDEMVADNSVTSPPDSAGSDHVIRLFEPIANLTPHCASIWNVELSSDDVAAIYRHHFNL